MKHKEMEVYYCGNWHHGKAIGTGLSYVPDSYIYKGDFDEGRPNGEGTLNFIDSEAYFKGHFVDGKAHGRGLFKDDLKGIIVKGEWVNSELGHGKIVFNCHKNIRSIEVIDQNNGVINYQGDKVYKGEINRKFEPHGSGQLIYP